MYLHFVFWSHSNVEYQFCRYGHLYWDLSKCFPILNTGSIFISDWIVHLLTAEESKVLHRLYILLKIFLYLTKRNCPIIFIIVSILESFSKTSILIFKSTAFPLNKWRGKDQSVCSIYMSFFHSLYNDSLSFNDHLKEHLLKLSSLLPVQLYSATGKTLHFHEINGRKMDSSSCVKHATFSFIRLNL